MQIALFGTSADPPTAAHQEIIRWLSTHFDEVMIWASDNPFKQHQTPLHHRMMMLQILIEDIQPPQANIHLRPDLSHPRALMTVERARLEWPQAEFTLVIGSDLVAQLPRWYRVHDLFQQVHLLVVPRPGYPLREEDLRHIQHLGARVAIADLHGLPMSSTDYREEKDTDILIPAVEAYIRREQLYQCQDETPNPLLTHQAN
ncbi:MAG TPA: nicotinate-nucleotide adenylyltransferase [Synechococcales cyanobacterium M55_K2018_004]|nr:nicotinate-nucleotide adenylyltransferase [Synechococcales cyanobacterium M55_K2018_004]